MPIAIFGVHMSISLIFKVMILFLIRLIYSSPLCWRLNLRWLINFEHVLLVQSLKKKHMSFPSPFLDSNLSTHHLNIGVCLRWVGEYACFPHSSIWVLCNQQKICMFLLPILIVFQIYSIWNHLCLDQYGLDTWIILIKT